MEGGRKYFRVTAWYHWLWVIPGLILVGVLAFNREIVPYESLGVFGTFLHYLAFNQPLLLKVGFITAIAVHVFEGCYAYLLSRRMNLTTRDTILWTVQTTLLGFSSLLTLKAKARKTKKKN